MLQKADSSRSLAEVYPDQLESDRQRKYTPSGFQRADIRFTCGGIQYLKCVLEVNSNYWPGQRYWLKD